MQKAEFKEIEKSIAFAQEHWIDWIKENPAGRTRGSGVMRRFGNMENEG